MNWNKLQTSSLEDMSAPIVQDALNHPENYCLKILREGGAAGNLFGREICSKMEEMKSNVDERSKLRVKESKSI